MNLLSITLDSNFRHYVRPNSLKNYTGVHTFASENRPITRLPVDIDRSKFQDSRATCGGGGRGRRGATERRRVLPVCPGDAPNPNMPASGCHRTRHNSSAVRDSFTTLLYGSPYIHAIVVASLYCYRLFAAIYLFYLCGER